MGQPPNPYAPPAAYGPPAYAQPYAVHPGALYPCARCGHPGADYFAPGQYPMHRPCAGLGPDTLDWPWIVAVYVVVVPVGCTFVGALLASIPYYVWRGDYPKRARTYNRHVWIAFAGSCVIWGSIWVLNAMLRG